MEMQIEPYEKYYARQAGGGIDNWYRGAAVQRGHGIGSFLGGLFRVALPFIKKGALSFGKEALNAGVNVLEDVENNVPFRQSFTTRLNNAQNNLQRKASDKLNSLLIGDGYKPKRKKKNTQSKRISRRRKSKNPKLKSRSKKRNINKKKKNPKRKRQTLRKKKKGNLLKSKYNLTSDIFN